MGFQQSRANALYNRKRKRKKPEESSIGSQYLLLSDTGNYAATQTPPACCGSSPQTATNLKRGDTVIIISPGAWKRGPFKVLGVDRYGHVRIRRESESGKIYYSNLYPKELLKFEGQNVQQALLQATPTELRCEICHSQPGVEHSFTTIPLPRQFMRLCREDYDWIKKRLQDKYGELVKEIIAEAKGRKLKKSLLAGDPFPINELSAAREKTSQK